MSSCPRPVCNDAKFIALVSDSSVGCYKCKLVHAGQIAEVIDIPATMVGKLIGKAGETIKQLQYSTNTKVIAAHATETPKTCASQLPQIASNIPVEAHKALRGVTMHAC